MLDITDVVINNSHPTKHAIDSSMGSRTLVKMTTITHHSHDYTLQLHNQSLQQNDD